MRAAEGGARTRTLVLVACQILALCGLALVNFDGGLGRSLGLPAIAVAPLFAVSGLLVFHLEFREEAHSFTFSELPLVVGLFFASPSDLLLGRLLGEVAALAFHPRQPPLKIVVNLTNFCLECAIALTIYNGLFGGPGVRSPGGWAAAFIAVLVADLVSVVNIGAIIRWHGGTTDVGKVAAAACASAAANSSLGVMASVLIDVHPAALGVLALLAGVLFAVYRGYSNLAERYASLQVLHDFSAATAGALGPAAVIHDMLHHARKLLRADVAELVLLDGDGTSDGRAIRARLDGDAPLDQRPLTAEEREALEALPQDRVTLQPRGRALAPEAEAYARDLGRTDFLHVPVRAGDVRCSIVVGGRLTDVSTFDEEDARLFATLANHAAMALEKGQLIEKLRVEARRREHQAMHDDLTGLPNRLHFHDACRRAIAQASGSSVGVMLMDLDQFKEINDTLGHQTGDELLVEVARRITAAIRKPDLAARLGGDEFAILIDGAEDEEAVMRAARRVLESLRGAIPVQGIELEIRASIGVAFGATHGDDPVTLLQHADIAMYAAKRNQTGVQAYSTDDDQHSPRRLQLAGELRRAIEDDDLVAHFQPKADLRTGRIVGAEALVRWTHADLGPIFPDEFIPVAEQTGLITPLTMLMLRQALQACAEWRRDGDDLGVAVNIATRSLLEPDFASDVAALLHKAQLPPSALTLEITESSIMSDTRRALDVLDQLAGLGVHLSVDDFGTGYSSLAYLQQLPVHELKVDKSFVFRVHDDAGSRAIVRSVVDLGHSLGLRVVAEGVENQLAWDHLLDSGCDIGQGYFLSRPIPAAEMLEWLQRRNGLASVEDRRPVPSSARLVSPVITLVPGG